MKQRVLLYSSFYAFDIEWEFSMRKRYVSNFFPSKASFRPLDDIKNLSI